VAAGYCRVAQRRSSGIRVVELCEHVGASHGMPGQAHTAVISAASAVGALRPPDSSFNGIDPPTLDDDPCYGTRWMDGMRVWTLRAWPRNTRSRAGVHRLVRRRRETGSIAPRKQTKFRRRVLADQEAEVGRPDRGAARCDPRRVTGRAADRGGLEHPVGGD